MIALANLTSLYRRSLQIPDFANSAFLKLLGQTGIYDMQRILLQLHTSDCRAELEGLPGSCTICTFMV